MTNDRLQELLNLILFTDEITAETDNAHIEICEAFDETEEQNKTLLKQWEINHFLTCLAEECGEVMEVMYLDPNNKGKIEHELNDIIAVAHLLHDKDILCVNLEVKQGETLDNSRSIYECVKNIQYFTHKSIRFGLSDTNPNSSRRNCDELHFSLWQLAQLIASDSSFNLWESFNVKIVKVLKYFDYAKRNTLGIYDNMKQSENF